MPCLVEAAGLCAGHLGSRVKGAKLNLAAAYNLFPGKNIALKI